MSEEILIKVGNVSRYYGPRCAIRDVSFDAVNGQITGFLGPNGAGKSTLMQVICGVLPASSGRVELAGHDLLEQPVEAKKQLGYLPESPPLYADCTVDEYLYYSARLHGVDRANLRQRVDLAREKCGLKDSGRRLIGNLSKGYRQRVGLAQAIVHSPLILVLDEPSSGLDPNQMAEMRELIGSLGGDHCVILSTHILAEAQNLCDRVMILHEGKVVLDKPVGRLAEDDAFSDDIIIGFSSAPPSMQLIESIDGVAGISDLGDNRFRVTAYGKSVAGAISRAAAVNGWELVELNREGKSLEQVYLRLTGNGKRDGDARDH